MTGLGVTTVSRALKDAPDIGAATKDRVRLVAKQIGYRPNRAGVRLRTGKTNVISLVVTTEDGVMGMTAPFISGISEYLRDTDYHLVVTPYHISQDPMDPIRYIVETGAADGVIISRISPDDPRVRYLTDNGLPFVTHGRTEMVKQHAYVDFDNQSFARQAVSRLAERNCDKVAIIGAPDYLTFSQHLNEGFISEVEKRDLQEIPIHNITIDSSFEAIQSELERILRSRHRFDGIVCSSASSTLAAIAAVEATGLKIGTDVQIAAKESFDLLRRIQPELIIFCEDFYAAGQALSEMVIGLINGNSGDLPQILQAPLEMPK